MFSKFSRFVITFVAGIWLVQISRKFRAQLSVPSAFVPASGSLPDEWTGWRYVLFIDYTEIDVSREENETE